MRVTQGLAVAENQVRIQSAFTADAESRADPLSSHWAASCCAAFVSASSTFLLVGACLSVFSHSLKMQWMRKERSISKLNYASNLSEAVGKTQAWSKTA